jgi:hypothetical protein
MKIVYIEFPEELKQIHSIEFNNFIYFNLSYHVLSEENLYNYPIY